MLRHGRIAMPWLGRMKIPSNYRYTNVQTYSVLPIIAGCTLPGESLHLFIWLYSYARDVCQTEKPHGILISFNPIGRRVDGILHKGWESCIVFTQTICPLLIESTDEFFRHKLRFESKTKCKLQTSL